MSYSCSDFTDDVLAEMERAGMLDVDKAPELEDIAAWSAFACDGISRLRQKHNGMLAALMRLLACPALNLEDMETEDLEAIEQANDAIGEASGCHP